MKTWAELETGDTIFVLSPRFNEDGVCYKYEILEEKAVGVKGFPVRFHFKFTNSYGKRQRINVAVLDCEKQVISPHMFYQAWTPQYDNLTPVISLDRELLADAYKEMLKKKIEATKKIIEANQDILQYAEQELNRG